MLSSSMFFVRAENKVKEVPVANAENTGGSRESSTGSFDLRM
jgi:hypothetical protein